MRSISKQYETARAPGWQRLPIIKCPAERHIDMPQERFDARIPPGKLGAERVWVAGSRPGLFHLFVCRNEAHIIDELARAQRERQKVLCGAEPHLPAIDRPVRHSFVWESAAIRD